MTSVIDPISDQHHIARVLGGDVDAFEPIMRRYNQRLYRAARAILRDDSAAEDALQQAYMSAFAHLGQFDGAASLSTWLTRIVINEALGRLRHDRRAQKLELDVAEVATMNEESETDSPEAQLSRREMAHVLERVVDQLPELYRVVFVLREVEQLSTAEVAESLALTIEAVKVRLHRARAMVRRLLLDEADEQMDGAYPFLGARCDRIVAAVLARCRPI